MKAHNELRGPGLGGKWFLGGGVIAAFVASLCCIGPLVVAGLGLGAFTAAGFFHALRPVFLWLAILLVAAAWIWDWRKRRRAVCVQEMAAANCDIGCRKDSRIVLAILSAVVLILAFSPYLLESLARRAPGDAPVIEQQEDPTNGGEQ